MPSRITSKAVARKPSYVIQEIFGSIQGEGVNAGRPAIFIRFSGCNLSCNFCDTDHTSHKHRVTLPELLQRVRELRSKEPGFTHIVLTGGEPFLQIDVPLLTALSQAGFLICTETNGTLVPDWLDEVFFASASTWITCSPKHSICTDIFPYVNEYKILVDEAGPKLPPALKLCFNTIIRRGHPIVNFQPIAESTKKATLLNTRKAIELTKAHPGTRLSIQLHKLLNIR